MVFLASTLRLGGAERVTGEVSRRLAKRGFDVTWALLREPGAEGERLRAAGLNVQAGLGGARISPAGVLRLLYLLRRTRPGALYCLDHQNAAVAGAMAVDWAGVPRRFLAVHTTGLWGGRPSLPRGIRLALPRFNRVIAVAEGQARYLAEREGVPAEKIAVVRNGIDLSAYRATPERAAQGRSLRDEILAGAGGPLLGVVAALRPEKGHELLLRALAAMAPAHPGARLALIGDGPEREPLAEKARRLGVAGAVSFLGARADVALLLQALDIVVLPSHPAVETLPLSLIEAMAAGRAVVATRVGSVDELVEDGTTGLLVPPGDPEALAAAIARLAGDPSLRDAQGRRGAERAGSFDIEATVDRTAALLTGAA